MSFLQKLKANFLNLINLPQKIFGFFKTNYLACKDYIVSFIHHIKILREANIRLGKYHLQNGKYKDASLRFIIIDKLFAPNDPENLYWHGVTYFLLNDFEKAKEKLKDNPFDTIGLYSYIENRETISVIPKNILELYYSTTSSHYGQRYYNKEVNAFYEFNDRITQFIPSEEDWDKTKGKYTILEIGANPLYTDDLSENFPTPFIIDTINFSSENAKKAKAYNDKATIYRQIITSERDDYIKDISSKYDLIIAFDCFSYSKNLVDNFKSIKALLTENGYFAFTLPKANTTRLSASDNCFMYTEEYIKDQLNLADFESASITSLSISKKFEFFMVVTQ